jgi:hypothetical protein
VNKIWIPDVEILNLKEFKTLAVLSKLEGLWLNRRVTCRRSFQMSSLSIATSKEADA